MQLLLQHDYKIDDIGTVDVNQVESSVFRADMVVTFTPASVTTEIKFAEKCHELLSKILPGTMSFKIKSMPAKDVRYGNVAGNSKSDTRKRASDFASR